MGVHAEAQAAVTCRLGHPDLERQPDLEPLLSSLGRSLPEKPTSPFLWVCSPMLGSEGRLPLYSKLLGKLGLLDLQTALGRGGIGPHPLLCPCVQQVARGQSVENTQRLVGRRAEDDLVNWKEKAFAKHLLSEPPRVHTHNSCRYGTQPTQTDKKTSHRTL